MKKYRIRYVGGALGLIWITILSMTVVLIPLAIVTLLQDLEIVERNS
ncbi:hypothetical protein Pla123a_45120 [Posidoniimonas polymericola]|uniref:Uncharacterized protein n=1 Tax=Posidoniimonas polymericola TaxID=2528002 RepID=A0A5C5XVA5_9BACT|nr:hypothetical protein [Posidoniimonas polymericola]TWT66814.1 hypothetical protein Pla123a_45120 [Posidoniimonas polymericola]